MSARLSRDPLVVLHDVAGIDHQHEVVGRHAVHQNVVDERPGRRREGGILDLADAQARRVVAGEPLNRSQRVGAGQLDLAHVADVEKTGPRSNGEMFVHDARVFDGHIPPAELDHSSADGSMAGVERRFLEWRLGTRHVPGIRPLRHASTPGESLYNVLSRS